MSAERDSQDKHEQGRGQDAQAATQEASRAGGSPDSDEASHRVWCQQQRVQFIAQPMPTAADLSDGGGGVHAVAQRGVAGAGQALPHADKIQAAFGHHDISHVKAHVGGEAAAASAEMGAEAYATGDQVAFKDQPSLHVAAHETAHVVQQRAGVSLKGGVGQTGDAYERQADAAADAVVRGDSAVAVLDRSVGGAATAAVQRQAVPPVDVSVTWSSPFGSDLSGTVVLFGTADKKHWTEVARQTVAASHTAIFAGTAHFKYYRAAIHPSDDVPDDDQAIGQFKETDLTSKEVAPGATQATIQGGLELNRWNRDNVHQRHATKKIDPAQSDESKVHAHPLFGRVVKVGSSGSRVARECQWVEV